MKHAICLALVVLSSLVAPARAADGEPNLMEIEIDYVVLRSNAFYNRVFPFYLNEMG